MARGRRDVDTTLLMALACGAPIESAAQRAGVSATTVYRRLKDPKFKQKLRRTRAEMVERAAGNLTAATTESVRTLLELQKPTIPPATRLGAARAVIELGTRLRESADLEQRVLDIEQRLEATDSSSKSPEGMAG
jgi:hypothetical protein